MLEIIGFYIHRVKFDFENREDLFLEPNRTTIKIGSYMTKG